MQDVAQNIHAALCKCVGVYVKPQVDILNMGLLLFKTEIIHALCTKPKMNENEHKKYIDIPIYRSNVD